MTASLIDALYLRSRLISVVTSVVAVHCVPIGAPVWRRLTTTERGRGAVIHREGDYFYVPSAAGSLRVGRGTLCAVEPPVATLGTVGDPDVTVLVRRAATGDELAWEALVDRYATLVWSVARGHSLDSADAADVSQTTWLRLAECLSSLREPDRVGAWLTTTARRESLRVLRRQQRHRHVETFVEWQTCETSVPLDQPLIEEERDAALWQAFDALSGPCKALLRALLADPPPSYAELSTAFDMPIGSIGPTRARCLDRLRDRVEPIGCDASDGERPVVVSGRRRVS